MLAIKEKLTWFGGIGLALLPKCPICYVTYSTSIAICGLESSPEVMGLNTPVILGLSSITIIFLLLNYRGPRTLLSLGLIVLGIILFLMMDSNLPANNYMYYLGSGAILSAVILNKKSLRLKSKDCEKTGITSDADCNQCAPSVNSISTNLN